ncbi:MAG: SufD family Fe-S cluster assembly protein, partial [Clostridia bacterium]|nr:SufD family Fe-S cluster assembly protein [Clostridia bacterium]
NDEYAETNFNVDLDGKDSSTHVVSRAVAKNNSKQIYKSVINGNNKCYGHTECDAIIMDKAFIVAKPELTAKSTDASLIHEAAIGKIAGEQIIKLQTLGLTEREAEKEIIKGFLK